MKSDFLLAITQLSAEKNLPKEVVIGAVETALVSAYRKEHFAQNQNIAVKLNPTSGRVEVWAEKTVVEAPSDKRREISLDEARRLKPDIQLGEVIMVEDTPHNAGRIAAQTAKQVILQRLHEAEHSAIFEEYSGKENDIITGVVQRIDQKQVYVNLGRTEAVLPQSEQIPTERYRIGQRLKFYLVEVVQTNKGPRVVLSRSHPNLLTRLFELEVPEVYNGLVEIKAVAREAGYRSKVAVAARQEGIDPVGCCVGLRGIRIQNIVNELNGEKIDIVMWSPDMATFVAGSLGPVQVLSVALDDGMATVVVPDRQLSLAIGKEGQNARLAAKLTGWRIDIKSASVAEAEKKVELPPEPKKEAVPTVAEVPLPVEEEVLLEEPEVAEEEVTEEAPEEKEAVPVLSTLVLPEDITLGQQEEESKSGLRFAEDIFANMRAKPDNKAKKKKKKGGKEKSEDAVRTKKVRKSSAVDFGEDEEF